MAGKPDPEYVKARRVLMDALAALSPHSDALVLVGAQAIYLRVGGSELAVAPYTTDGDLVIHPGELLDSPLLEQALDDGRCFTVRVAGPAALLVSKLHKIADREGRPDRLGDKDALDILRLLQGTKARELAGSLHRLLASEVSGDVTRQALGLLQRLFGIEDAPGVEMAVRATEGLEEAAVIRLSCTMLAAELLEATGSDATSTDPKGPRR